MLHNTQLKISAEQKKSFHILCSPGYSLFFAALYSQPCSAKPVGPKPAPFPSHKPNKNASFYSMGWPEHLDL